MVHNKGIVAVAKRKPIVVAVSEYRLWVQLPYEVLYEKVREITELGQISYPLSNQDIEEIICKSSTIIEIITELCSVARGLVLRARVIKDATVKADMTTKRDMLLDVLSAVKRRWDTASRVATLRMDEFGRPNWRKGKE